jgi:hypothetical protein
VVQEASGALDDLLPLLSSLPVDYFPDSQDAFVILPLPPQPLDLQSW